MILDLRGITTKEQFHDAVKEQLHLPEYYGRNLDALHDCIMELPPKKNTGADRRRGVSEQS